MSEIHVDQKDSALLVCPNCGKKKSIELSKCIGRKLSVSCSCGQKFTCRIKNERIALEKDEFAATPKPSGFATISDLTFSVDKNGKSLLTCPNCGIEKEIEIPVRSQLKSAYSIKCKCGHKFKCRFEPDFTEYNKEKGGGYFFPRNGESSSIKERVCFVAGEGTAKIICEKCGFIRLVKSGEVPLLRRPFSFHCKCGHIFPCRVDERKKYRKPTELNGDYINHRTLKKGSMVVKISHSGSWHHGGQYTRSPARRCSGCELYA